MQFLWRLCIFCISLLLNNCSSLMIYSGVVQGERIIDTRRRG